MSEYQFQGFNGGLNNSVEPHLIAANEAQHLENVTFENGKIKGHPDVAASQIATAPGAADVNSVWYAANAWIDSTTQDGNAVERRHYCNDGNRTYYTRKGKPPMVKTPSISHPLGLKPLSSISYDIAGGNLTGFYKYAITFATDDGLESNPQIFDLQRTLSSQKVTFTIPKSNDARVTKRRIWRTKADDDIFYLLKTVENNDNNATYEDNSPDTDLDLDIELTWRELGFPTPQGEAENQYTEDHAAPPVLDVISDSLHAVSGNLGDVAVSGSGILFAGTGATARWSMTGFPDYFPLLNSCALNSNIEAIKYLGGVTYYLCTEAIYSAHGVIDDAISWAKTSASVYARSGVGHSAVSTPHGILYLAREGLAAFDGSFSRVFSTRKLSQAFVSALDVRQGAYFEHFYYLFCASLGGVGTINITSGGSGYGTTAPTVTFSAPNLPGGRRARGYATVTAGAVSSIVIEDPGNGYTSLPTITLTGNATATVTAFNAGTLVCDLRGGLENVAFTLTSHNVVAAHVTDFTEPSVADELTPGLGWLVASDIEQGGSGYSTGNTATFNAPTGGTAAIADIVAVGGVTTELRITNPGYGYQTEAKVASSTGGAGLRASGVVEPVGYRFVSLVSDGTSKLYKAGGVYIDVIFSGAGDVVTNRFEEYDLNAGKWTIKANVPANFNAGAMVFNSPYVYAFGGSTTTTASSAANGTMWRFAPGSNWWDSLASTSARSGHGMCIDAANGHIYIVCGYDNGGNATNTLIRYNIAANTYTTLANAPETRAGCTASLLNGKIYVFGGVDNISTVLIYDVAGNSWTTDTTGLANGFVGRSWCGSFAHNGKIYIHGGRVSSNGVITALSDLWAYDPAKSPKWDCSVSEVVGIGGRQRHGVANINGDMFVFGGQTDTNLANGDFYRVNAEAIADCHSETNLYVVLAGDGGKIKGWKRGSDLAWKWIGADVVGGNPYRLKTWLRARLDAAGTLTVKIIKDGSTFTTAKQVSSAVRGTPTRFWLPQAVAMKGQRLTPKIDGNAGSELHSLHIEGKEDGVA
jgi:N-acetylneuraminic acid mutarotase